MAGLILGKKPMCAATHSLLPKGSLEICGSPPIYKEGKLISKGSKTTRVCFEDLPDEAYRIAVSLSKCCNVGTLPFHLMIHNKRQRVSLNLQSLIKRFGLPERVIRAASENRSLGRIIQLVKDKLAFQVYQEAPLLDDNKGDVPMLSKGNSALISLQEIAHQAVEQQRGIKLSKKIFDIPLSIEVTRDGFIASLSPSDIGKGAHAVVKKAKGSDQTPLARRVCKEGELYERLFQNMQRFKRKKGLLDTYSTEVFINKMGKSKAVSYHPAYEKELFDLIHDRENYSERDVLDIAHHLLTGLAEIAKVGMHGDMTLENALARRVAGRMEAVISDFESFSLLTEAQGEIFLNIWSAPETIRGARKTSFSISPEQKRDVWPLGAMLYCIFQKQIKKNITLFPWLVLSKRELAFKAPLLQTKENIDRYINRLEFHPAIATLLKGMLQVEPAQRWTAQQALDYFENNLLPPK